MTRACFALSWLLAVAWRRTEGFSNWRMMQTSVRVDARVCADCIHHKETTMNKGKHGNKEAKKPKKVRVPNPPGLPAGLAPLVVSPLKPRKA